MKRATVSYAVAAMALLLSTATVSAQPPGSGEAAFQIRAGGFFPRGGGELWDTNEEVFTLDVSDFDDFTIGFSYVYSVNNNLEVGFNLDLYDSTVLSQYEFDCAPGVECVDEDGFPILHDTELTMVPLSLDVRFVPGGRYRHRGPHGRAVLKPTLYVGGGLGVNFYQYEEIGDFLDFEAGDPPLIVPGRFKETGQAFQTHVLAGVDLPMSREMGLTFEGRYTFAEEDLGGDFAGLGNLELGGLSLTAGLSFRF